ncbi:uncharacterized protein LOC100876595 isoform X1 [Megachile rotundata]|uniref:uncharacterized protein LOC100876595 isoform X1 n=1 Tax=Megachile rotundata TaxID=143995 RepID=UPI003FCF1FC6
MMPDFRLVVQQEMTPAAPEKPEWHEHTEDSSMSGLVGSLRGLEDNTGNITQPYRRNSLALSLHSNLAAFPVANNQEVSPFHVVDSARRRFSNVSDVVTRKISHTIRWRTVSASVELTVSQGSSLCAQYIRNRLKRSGIFHRKLGLKRMRSVMLLPGGAVVGEVYPELISIGAELEKMHPNLFNRVARQIGCGNFSSEQSASEAIVDVSREMIRNGEMTWSKVIALYAIAGGIAVDCVRQGKPEFLPAIQRVGTFLNSRYDGCSGGGSRCVDTGQWRMVRFSNTIQASHERDAVVLVETCTVIYDYYLNNRHDLDIFKTISFVICSKYNYIKTFQTSLNLINLFIAKLFVMLLILY